MGNGIQLLLSWNVEQDYPYINDKRVELFFWEILIREWNFSFERFWLTWDSVNLEITNMGRDQHTVWFTGWNNNSGLGFVFFLLKGFCNTQLAHELYPVHVSEDLVSISMCLLLSYLCKYRVHIPLFDPLPLWKKMLMRCYWAIFDNKLELMTHIDPSQLHYFKYKYDSI